MATTKINNKTYTVPQLGFGHMERLESEGYDIAAMFKRNQAFAPVSAFIMLCVNCDRQTANTLAEQHVLGGGTLNDLQNDFLKALEESVFFKKILGLDEENKKIRKKSSTSEMEAQ